jgi:Acyl-CoA carboxylase epsilon subunit
MTWSAAMSDEATGAPRWRVERGSPDEHELAALLAVLAAAVSARRAAVDQSGRAAVSGWADPAGQPSAPVSPGPDAWRASCLPR